MGPFAQLFHKIETCLSVECNVEEMQFGVLVRDAGAVNLNLGNGLSLRIVKILFSRVQPQL